VAGDCSATSGLSSSSFQVVPVTFDPPANNGASSKRRINENGTGSAAAAVSKRSRRLNVDDATESSNANDESDNNASTTSTNFNRYVRLSDHEFLCGKRLCKQRIESWNEYVEHQLSEHKLFVAVCPVVGCERVFMNAASLLGHWARHAAPGVACTAPQCARLASFASWRDYRIHCRAEHAVREGGQCPTCTFETNSLEAMQIHVLQKHPLSANAASLSR
jgi:hypothetical protein